MTLEELQEQVLQLNEKITTLEGDNANLKKEVEGKSSRVSELEQYNQKLFLRATSTKKEEEKLDKFESKLLGDYIDLLSDEEIEFLKEIEEDL